MLYTYAIGGAPGRHRIYGVRADCRVLSQSGYFNKLDDEIISGGELSAKQMKSNIDGMIKKSFTASSGLNFLVYLISLSRSAVLFVLALILIALIAFMVLKVMKVEDCPGYVDAIKIVGSFQLWSAILTFVLTFIFSFFRFINVQKSAHYTIYIVLKICYNSQGIALYGLV